MEKFNQIYKNDCIYLIETTKSVDWLVNNTEVMVFNPNDFTGYQRKINEKHCKEIVSYLEENFYLPTSIICACDNMYDDSKKLRVVDGQHRIHALRMLKESNNKRYSEIENMFLPVLVLENPNIKVEIETFISINKKTKKVDTSLAYVLRNKINRGEDEKDLSISKKEYLSVELAARLNNNIDGIWSNKISLEGGPKTNDSTISLSAFVNSTKRFIGCLEQKQYINFEWSNEKIEMTIKDLILIIDSVWKSTKIKWPNLFINNYNNSIIQGSIGYSSINKYLIFRLKKDNRSYSTIKELCCVLEKYINEIRIKEIDWLPGESFSKYSSESGYSIVAEKLYDSIL